MSKLSDASVIRLHKEKEQLQKRIEELEAALAELFAINNRNVKLYLTAKAQLEKEKEFAKRCADSPVGKMVKQLEKLREIDSCRADDYPVSTQVVTVGQIKQAILENEDE